MSDDFTLSVQAYYPHEPWTAFQLVADATVKAFPKYELSTVGSGWTAYLNGGVRIRRTDMATLRSDVIARPETLEAINGGLTTTAKSEPHVIALVFTSFTYDDDFRASHGQVSVSFSAERRLDVLDMANAMRALNAEFQKRESTAWLTVSPIGVTSSDDPEPKPVEKTKR